MKSLDMPSRSLGIPPRRGGGSSSAPPGRIIMEGSSLPGIAIPGYPPLSLRDRMQTMGLFDRQTISILFVWGTTPAEREFDQNPLRKRSHPSTSRIPPTNIVM